VISSEIVCYFSLQGSARETSPEYLFPLHHCFVRLRYASIEVQEAALLGVGFQLPCKFLFVILLELLLYSPDNGRYLLILTFPEELVHFLVSVVAGVKIDETFQCGVLLFLLEFLLGDSFLPVVCYLLEHEGEDVSCSY